MLSRRKWLALSPGVFAIGAPGAAVDVSRQFQAAEGVTVKQITDTPLGSQLSNYDVPCDAPDAGRLIFNSKLSQPKGKNAKPETWGILSSRLDGSEPILLVQRIPATPSTARVGLSLDGKLVTYTRRNDDAGWDLYGFRVGEGRHAAEFRITKLRTPLNFTLQVETSPPVWDARVGEYLCSFSIDEKAYLVYADGRRLPEPPLTDLEEFPERRAQDRSFRRVRLNPAFPDLLHYQRNGVKDNWVIDLSAAKPRSRRIGDDNGLLHATWSNDGRVLAGSMLGPWEEWQVADGEGRLLESLQKREAGPFGAAGKPGANYGCYSPDNRQIAIATRFDQEPGGSLWLMNRETGKAVYLCLARYFGPAGAGQPRIGFADNGRALAFSSDNSAGAPGSRPPQVFVASPLPAV